MSDLKRTSASNMKLLKGFLALFLNLFSSVFICASEETQVSCVFNESCVLPCSFQSGSDPVIHWYKTPGDVRVHIYYYDQDQVQHQNQDFKERTSLFVDQISRGNASLLLREVKVQDEGTYKCYTSTDSGDKTSFINHRVHAPVGDVVLEQRGDELICSSTDIYPKPDVTWSGPDVTGAKTEVIEKENKLYSIHSSVRLSDGQEHSCTVSTGYSWRRTTLKQQDHTTVIIAVVVVTLGVIVGGVVLAVLGDLVIEIKRNQQGTSNGSSEPVRSPFIPEANPNDNTVSESRLCCTKMKMKCSHEG